MKLHETLLLLLLPLSTCWAEVVEDFIESCPKFFIKRDNVHWPPTRFNGPQYKQICQTLNNEPRFATFYDTKNKIPVYSAYGFKVPEGERNCKRRDTWHIEPQLYNPSEHRKNMETSKNKLDQNKHGFYQAIDSDYTNSMYHRGHLIPCMIAHNQDSADATFTLTNAAPQHSSFNMGKWKSAEMTITKLVYNICKNMDMYWVTGVVPGNNKLNVDRVTIPSHFWFAYCCLQGDVPKRSGGYIKKNEGKKIKIVSKNKKGSKTEQMSIQHLEEELTELYERQLMANNEGSSTPSSTQPRFTVFNGKCNTGPALPVSPKGRKRLCYSSEDEEIEKG